MRTSEKSFGWKDTLFHCKQWTPTNSFSYKKFKWFTNLLSFLRLPCRLDNSLTYQLSPVTKYESLVKACCPLELYFNIIFILFPSFAILVRGLERIVWTKEVLGRLSRQCDRYFSNFGHLPRWKFAQ